MLSLNGQNVLTFHITKHGRDKRVRHHTARRVLKLRVQERPQIWRVAANILNKQSRTANKRRSFSLGFG